MFLRRAVPWLLGGVFVILGAVTISQVIGLRAELESQVSNTLRQQLEDQVANWESGLVDKLDLWLVELATDPKNAWLTQVRFRQREPWFDSAYLWRPPTEASVRGKRIAVPAVVIFPMNAPSEDDRDVHNHPCVRRAKMLSMSPSSDPVRVARSFVNGCRGEPAAVRLVAATEAALQLQGIDLNDRALQALDSGGIDPTITLRAGIQQGLSPFRLTLMRLQRAQILQRLGNEPEALDLWEQTGVEIASLDAPEAAGLLQYIHWPILEELRAHGREDQAARLQQLQGQAERRGWAWKEVAERILPRDWPGGSTEARRFVYDQFHETPFVLYYGPTRSEGQDEYSGALQLDQPLLLAEFMATLRRYRQDLVITDAGGNWVAGALDGGSVVVQVPFRTTLTHLRVGLRASALATPMGGLSNQWVLPLAVTLFCLLLGMAAVVTQIRASRRQELVLRRQREFTTRVTHELKTPLAGIKVMAENLEAGVFRDAAHRAAMAQRIIDEADRLTTRVDEILRVGRTYTVPRPMLFDPEEAVLDAIDHWGPRLEQAGIAFTADLHPVSEFVGDGEAFRDAVGCLLDNALKYRDGSRSEPRVVLTLTQTGRYVVVDVSDNGIGVPADHRKAIFERFVRVEGPNRGMAGGHGLGLAQVAAVVRAHRGSAECSQGIDGGARFTLRFRHA